MDPQTRLHQTPFSVALQIAILAASLAAFYHQTIEGLLRFYRTDGDYSYVWILPLVVGYIIWKRRSALVRAAIRTNWPGGFWFLVFFLISLYGIIGSSPSAVRPALPIVVLAIVLFCFGRQVFTLLFFPLALLVFMIPLPTLLQTQIGGPLKLVSTGLGVGLLRAAGVSVFVEGNIIDLGVTQLQVVDACSGLRYLLPLLALGVIFAHFFEKTAWKRVSLVLATIPIAIFANGIRIGITGFLAQRYGPDAAEGFFHGFSGWLIFVFALSLMVLLHRLLLLVPSNSPVRGGASGSDPAADGVGKKSSHNWTAVVITSVVLLGGGLWSLRISNLPPLQLSSGLSSFPLSFGGWTGTTETLDPRIVELSGAEEAFNAAYFTNGGGLVSLYIGYRGSPFTESANFFHSPNVCMPSLGWKTLQIDSHTIDGVPVFGQLTVRKMVIEKMGIRQLVYYWFQTNRRVSADVNLNRLHLTLHALERKNTYDLFIRPITPVGPAEDAAMAEARLDRFTRALMSTLTAFLAENVVAPDGVK